MTPTMDPNKHLELFKQLPPIFDTLTPNVIKTALKSMHGDPIDSNEVQAGGLFGGETLSKDQEWQLPDDVANNSPMAVKRPTKDATSTGALGPKQAPGQLLLPSVRQSRICNNLSNSNHSNSN